MSDEPKTREELLAEIEELRGHVARLQAAAAERSQTEENYRSLLEACPDAVVMSDLQGRVLFASPQTWDLLGFPRALSLCGQNAVDYVVESDRPRLAKNIAHVIEAGVRRNTEYKAFRHDGTSLPVEVSSAVIRNAAGEPTAAMAIIHDVTERNRVQQELRQSHDELRAIYDSVVDGLIIVDLETEQCVRANPQMARMLGYTPETIPTDPARVHRPEDFEHIAACFHKQVEGLLPVAENIPFVHKDGHIVYADISGTRMEYRQRPCLIALIRDVTRRKQAEEALRASEERFRAAFEAAPVGVVVVDDHRRVTRANRAMCQMLGFTPEELLGRFLPDSMHPDDRDLSLPLFHKLLAGEIPSYTVEKRYVRKTGEAFWVQATTAAILDPDGRFDFALAIVEDIDERKRSREALHREHQTLWRMLRSSDHERQLIAYEIHDGLAQQLAAAAMQFQTYEHLRDKCSADAKTTFDAGLQILRQAHLETRRLISGVRPPILDESGIVAAIAHLVHDQLMTDGPKIEFQSDVQFGRLAPVLENAIYRIAQESMANACKHSKSDRIQVRLAQSDDRVRLQVCDWGVGFRPDDVRRDSYGIEGIRERVRLLGGSMTIDSRPGEGTRLDVVLPLLDQEPHDGL